MESRGDNTDEPSKVRPAIARRSCDQCRARKIGCERGSPCSNCVSAKLDCTRSAVATRATPPKQRVLISAQYEQKIDGIAKSVDGIRLLLQGLSEPPGARHPETGSTTQLNQADSVKPPIEQHPVCVSGSEPPPWDKSAHIIDFVKAVVEDRGSRDTGSEENEVLSSLRSLVQSLENPAAVAAVRHSSFNETKIVKYVADPFMPPLDAVLAVLRWAKDHLGYTRIKMISQILPLEKFTEICQRVYFAVNDYGEVDFILANGYLSYIFSEHVVVSGLQDYREYYRLCQKNFHNAFARLPLLLPPGFEVVAALTLGAFNAIENSKASMAWTFISTASSLCQTLGYHRLYSSRQNPQALRATEERLFWTVYEIDRGLSLRLGRSSNIRDAEITLQIDPNESRRTRLARIQGKVYDQLYSPVGLALSDNARAHIARTLAGELRELINAIHIEVSDATTQPSSCETDPMRVIYLQCDLVCHSSLLALILRAINNARSSLNGVSDDCVAVARHTLDLHQQCMMGIRDCKNNPFMLTIYFNWAILHTPFVPFSILFTRAFQALDVTDLGRLDSFAGSLKPDTASQESISHHFRLYELLCQATCLYIQSNIPYPPAGPTLTNDLPDYLGEFNFGQFQMETEAAANETLEADGAQTYGLSDWYYGNQQIMSLLDEDVMF